MRPERGVQASTDCIPTVQVSLHSNCPKRYILLVETICRWACWGSPPAPQVLIYSPFLRAWLSCSTPELGKGLRVRCGTQNFRKCSGHRAFQLLLAFS